ncbi:hypothetical protein [Erythrobacter sp. R86502]|uniref:hypothetical protein n=1 Tax=Erythrobacter sp. R86502 TaxID=3093846 RepID=UPI0036D38CFC
MSSTSSALPLVKMLTLRDGMRVWFDGMPEAVIDEIDEYALELYFVVNPSEGIDAAHIFVTEQVGLAQRLALLRQQIAPEGQIWVSWPDASSGSAGTMDADTIRSVATPLGLIDTKTCAIEGWDSLKLVIRKELR